jgi:hypothetical protein
MARKLKKELQIEPVSLGNFENCRLTKSNDKRGGRLGDEVTSQTQAIQSIADKTGPPLLPNPKSLYRAHSSQPRRDMAGPTTRAQARWAVDYATSLSEIWAIVAGHLGLVGAWQLMLVCRAACSGAKEFLGTLPGLVVCGGIAEDNNVVSDVWRLDLATMRWNTMSALITARAAHACCAVRGALVVLAGVTSDHEVTSSVEMLSEGQGAFTASPPLSCGDFIQAATVVVEDDVSAVGQVLVLGGWTEDHGTVSAVHLVDLATGVCTPKPNLLHARFMFAAARLPDGCVVCAGGCGAEHYGADAVGLTSAEILVPPDQGSLDAAWTRRECPALNAGRYGCRGYVLSDGRFAVVGGGNNNNQPVSSCEALAIGDGEHWELLPQMHDARVLFAGAAVAGCIIVAGGHGLKSAEVFDEVLDRWLRLPYDLPLDGGLHAMGSALL